MSATDVPRYDDEDAEPLEKVDGWSIWPPMDGVHLATRDKPLTDREVRTLTMTRSLYASSHDGLLAKITKQNAIAAELAECVR